MSQAASCYWVCMQGGVSKQSAKAKVAKAVPQQSSPMTAIFKALLPLLILAIAVVVALSYRPS